jgi:HK97 family phage prohead protease
VVDQGGDLVEKSAFDKSLASGRRPQMLLHHDPRNIVGVWDEVKVDSRGLLVKGRILQDLQQGKEAHILMKEGALRGLSIGYRTQDFGIEKREGKNIRVLKEVDLFEISLVTFPMNTEAEVTDVKQLQSPRDVERLLTKAGVPVNFAKLVALHGFEEATNRLKDCRDGDDEAKEQEALRRLHEAVQGLKGAFHA